MPICAHGQTSQTHEHKYTASVATGEAQTKRRLHLTTRVILRSLQKKWRLESAAYIHLVLTTLTHSLPPQAFITRGSEPRTHTRAQNKNGNILIKVAHEKSHAEICARTQTPQMVFKRKGSEYTLLSVLLLSASTRPLDSRAHILYLICPRLALHNVNIILHYPGTLQPSYP